MSKVKIAVTRHGGKSKLADWIVSHFPEHRVYVEPFCGSCAVLFAKEKSEIEVINDKDEDIFNIYRTILAHPKELSALIFATPYSVHNWNVTPRSKLEQARQYIAKSKQHFVGNYKKGTRLGSLFALDRGGGAKAKTWANWFKRVLPAFMRLREVQMHNKDAVKIIQNFNRKDTLIYCDPPYVGHERDYKHEFSEEDYQEMVRALKRSKAMVIVSDTEKARHHFVGWWCVSREVQRNNSFKGKCRRSSMEVLYANFPLRGGRQVTASAGEHSSSRRRVKN